MAGFRPGKSGYETGVQKSSETLQQPQDKLCIHREAREEKHDEDFLCKLSSLSQWFAIRLAFCFVNVFYASLNVNVIMRPCLIPLQLIYKRYASLYFVTGVDASDNELITLEVSLTRHFVSLVPVGVSH